jgi:hypothetical protein
VTHLILALFWALGAAASQPKGLDTEAESRLLAERDAFWAQAQPAEAGAQPQGGIEALGIKLVQSVKDGQTVCTGTYKAGWVPAFEYRFRGAILLQGQDWYPDGALMHRVDLGSDGSRREAFYSHAGQALLSLEQGPAGRRLAFLGASATAQGWALPEAWPAALQAWADAPGEPAWQLASWGQWPRLKVQRLVQRVEGAGGAAELRLRAEGFSARLPMQDGRVQGLVQVAAWDGRRAVDWAAFEAVSGTGQGRSLAVAGALSPGAAAAGSYGRMAGGLRQGPWVEWRHDEAAGAAVLAFGEQAQGRRQGWWRERWDGKGCAQEQVFDQGVGVGGKRLLRGLGPAGLAPDAPYLLSELQAEGLSQRFPDGCRVQLLADGAGLLRQAPEPCPGADWQAPAAPALSAPAADPEALRAACLDLAKAGTLQVKLQAQWPDPAQLDAATVSLPQLGWAGGAYQVRREGLWVWDPARLRSYWFGLDGQWQGWRDDSEESAGQVAGLSLAEAGRLRAPSAPAPWTCTRQCAGAVYRFDAGAADDAGSALSLTVRHEPDHALLGTVRFKGAWSRGPVYGQDGKVTDGPASPSPALGRDDASVYVLTRAQGALQLWKLSAFQ